MNIQKTTTMIINSHSNDKLSGYHVLHMKIDNQIHSKSVDNWIFHDPVLLYQAVMGLINCCVVYPTMTFYSPSLQHSVLKKLEEKVNKIRPDLVFKKTVRRAKRVCIALENKEREKMKEASKR